MCKHNAHSEESANIKAYECRFRVRVRVRVIELIIVEFSKYNTGTCRKSGRYR
jgi:hypothetical protein